MLGIRLGSNYVFTRDDRSVVMYNGYNYTEVGVGGEPISQVYETRYHTILVTDSGRVFKACMDEKLTLEERIRQTEYLGMYVNIWCWEFESAYVVVENNGRKFTYYSFAGGVSMFRCAVTNAFPSRKDSPSVAYVGDLLFIDCEVYELPGLGKVDPSKALDFIRHAFDLPPLADGLPPLTEDFENSIEVDLDKLTRRRNLEQQLVVDIE